MGVWQKAQSVLRTMAEALPGTQALVRRQSGQAMTTWVWAPLLGGWVAIQMGEAPR